MKLIRFEVGGRLFSGTLRDGLAVSAENSFPLSKVQLRLPVVPTKIICVGVNYRDHAAEMGRELPERPMLFLKPPSALIGPEDAIELPDSARVDYEGEVAVVIKTRCRKIAANEASDVILGYSGFNDITDRVAQGWERNWVRAKAFDKSAALGPAIVTPDELAWPLQIETRLNGQVRQKSDTSQLITSIPAIIEEITSFMTLEPGDVIATGTPAGVGPLRPGDLIEVEIPGIGVLRNRVTGSPARQHAWDRHP
jgi:2-keto-4-pentenoate hydratase/2-oxohepta-3-ene-1,7-dioic acid hydratase in catechol pathway